MRQRQLPLSLRLARFLFLARPMTDFEDRIRRMAREAMGELGRDGGEIAAVVVEPVEPLALKGKAEPVPAFRLLAVPGPPERSHASPFVWRKVTPSPSS